MPFQFSVQMPKADDARSWTTTVLDNDFRHPVMVAKEIATLDLMSDGRVDLGMGAGWLEEDYTRTGIATWDAAGTRVERLWESIDVLYRLLTGDEVTFHGEHYRIEGFRSYPVPVQSHVPLMIGAGGRRMLSESARRADIISLIVQLRGSMDRRRAAFEEQLGWIADAGGLDRPDLRIGVRVLFGAVCTAGESRRAAAEGLARTTNLDVDDVLTSPFGMVGDLAAIRDHLHEVHERYRLSYFTLNEDLALQLAPLIDELSR